MYLQDMVKMRKVKTSLEMARKQTVLCRTTRIEDQIKKDLLKTRESFFTDEELEKVVLKEERRKRKQERAMANARINLLRQKEKIKTIQAVRKGDYPEKDATPSANTGARVTEKKGSFHAIDVSY